MGFVYSSNPDIRRATRAAADTTVLSKISVPEVDEPAGSAGTEANNSGTGDAVVADEVTSSENGTLGDAADSAHDEREKKPGDTTEGNADDEENTHA